MEVYEERFWSKAEKTDGCWNWKAAIRGKSGYGAFKLNGRTQSAHRIAYMLFHQREILPKDMQVCHKCDNRLCVNPEHLFLGTGSDNMIDCKKKGRLVMPQNPHRFKEGHIPMNSSVSKEKALEIKKTIKNSPDVTLKKIAANFSVKYQFVRDLNSNRTFTDVII